MVKRTVMKVDIRCGKCKQKLMLAVSRFQGIDKIEADAASSTLTVTGNVDPVDVIARTRKVVRCVEVVSIGPPPKPQEPKKPEEGKKAQSQAQAQAQAQAHEKKQEAPMALIHVPTVYHVCQHMEMGVPEPEPSCSIM